MKLPPEKLAEILAEHDWILWKMEEDKKSIKNGNSEYSYSRDSGELEEDEKRLNEIKHILKSVKTNQNEY